MNERKMQTMATEEKHPAGMKHNLILEGRRVLTVSGVSDVSGFDEQSVVLITGMGELAVKGSNLHINKFSTETGELSLDGDIYSLVYSENKQTEGGFFSRLFK